MNPVDKRFHQLSLAVQKAINGNETPLKGKHVRSIIIGTFQDQSAATYWMLAIRQPLQDNRIVAWKFCHVTHKLLREGHPACLEDSQRHIPMIENLGKLWVHLREGYGKLVHLYCKLLVCKLKFHARNRRFPGNLQLTSDELDAIAENDVNNYFQLCVELFDYMDDILNLQKSVFESLGNARANSMTASGQCRLAALIPCAQDSSQIYDCNVRLLFRLHAAIPADILAGHRDRFRQQFRKLCEFYKEASKLQYYRNLLTLPVLPSNPPNFLLQSDFGTYVTPVVSIPDPSLDETDHVGALIDTSVFESQSSTPEQMDMVDTRATPSPQPDLLLERDRLIDHLQNELKRMRMETGQMAQEQNTVLASMREHCTRLETQLQATKYELNEEKVKSETLSAQTPVISEKLTMVEEKAKVQDEKFQKLKGAYTQLREEHIALIRQKAEVDKTAANLRASAKEHENVKMSLQQQLNDKMKDVELLQQNASSSEELEAYKTEIEKLRSELETARQKDTQLDALRASMEALEIEHKTATTESQDKLDTMATEIKELQESIERVNQEKVEKENELSKVNEELVGFREKSGEQLKKAVEEKEEALKQITELKEEYNKEKQGQEKYVNDLKENLEKIAAELDHKLIASNQEMVKLKTEYESKEKDLSDQIKEQQNEIVLLQEKFKLVYESKSELMGNLKNIMSEKDDSMINLTVDVEKLRDEVQRYQDELDERNAELEIAKNELMSMRDEYEDISSRNDDNLFMKNKELRELTEKVNALVEENKILVAEKGGAVDGAAILKEEYEKKIEDLTVQLKNTEKEYDRYKIENEECVLKLKEDISVLNSQIELIKNDKDSEVNKISTEIEEKEANFNSVIEEKQALLVEAEMRVKEISSKFEEKQEENRLKIEELENIVGAKEEENKDLLQQNTSLEENVADLKRQLIETQMELEKQRSTTLSCASTTAIDVTSSALENMERHNTQENNRAAANMAAKAFEDIGKYTQVTGNEEFIAKSALIAAHNTAQLSSYVLEVSNTSTNVELSDQLTQECKTMLSKTKNFLEALNSGTIDSTSSNEAQKQVTSMLKNATSADVVNTGNRSVDDELADMDSAIEEAAGRIEEMLTKSRAADSGVKLEVNGKILDACTTLMAAVKILVQQSRKLQNELGDPKTRQKMYRRNPQWSEGLISASKAVVFAAKLLVTSADEAVGSAGRVEGVSAAAHEVAGSTAQLVAASRVRAPPAAPALAALTAASREVATATGAVVAAVRAAAALQHEQEALDTSSLTLTATRILEMESKVRSLELESALEAERVKLAALRKRHYQLAQQEENGNLTNGKE